MGIYLTSLVSLLVLDGLWITVIAKSFYKKYLGYIFAEQFVLWPAALFYLLYAFGIFYFVVTPAIEAKSLSVALFRGALLGLLAYSTYDLTNHATIARWPLIITLTDIAWGTFVTAVVSAIAYFVATKF
ncbi:MAG: DUF2177 family protein [bacterium]|nr:DUF2177 family protein [Candidatus Jorgensenbacteria bacterium]